MNRQPIGIMPKRFWQEERLEKLKECIQRYTNAYCPIKEEWIKEYNELLAELNANNN